MGVGFCLPAETRRGAGKVPPSDLLACSHRTAPSSRSLSPPGADSVPAAAPPPELGPVVSVSTFSYEDPHQHQHGTRLALECLREVAALCLPCKVWDSMGGGAYLPSIKLPVRHVPPVYVSICPSHPCSDALMMDMLWCSGALVLDMTLPHTRCVVMCDTVWYTGYAGGGACRYSAALLRPSTPERLEHGPAGKCGTEVHRSIDP